ncbi:hypothetical protein KSX_86000 [Ktedonospora formicarum]|uniref:Uncharacterized protein n=1 Tax=Ktedonospora formicarum TaxID=2778364 RepID=A0A8J3ICX5_9CHLR|nr:hypothetical protein KSX_86000 [Ktedonospora formicarum]
MHSWIALELLDKGFMADMVETASDIGVQDIFGLFTDIKEDGTDGIMTGTSRAKSIAVNLSRGVTSSTRLQNRAC